MKKIKLLACPILQQEVEYLLSKKNYPDLEIQWLELGLHDNVERLEEEITLRAKDTKGEEQIALLFGYGCLPQMKELSRDLKFRHLNARNCLEAVAGKAGLTEMEKDKSLVATPGWIRKMWLGRANTPLGWKADDFRINFGRYDSIIVLDPGIEALTDEEIINCFDLIGVPIDVRPCNLDILQESLEELLALK